MNDSVKDNRLYIETPPVRHNSADLIKALDRFAEKYQIILNSGDCACLTDNAMGQLSFQGYELISELALPVKADKIIMHLNTYHSKQELDQIMAVSRHLGIQCFLIVTGDGNERLQHLEAEEIGAAKGASVTSVELMQYIKREYSGILYGCAFNQYEPCELEFAKLERKLDAGAAFIMTQPVFGGDEIIDQLIDTHPDTPVILGAWMSKNLKPIIDIVGNKAAEYDRFDPMKNLEEITERYQGCGVYLSMLGFGKQYEKASRIWSKGSSGD